MSLAMDGFDSGEKAGNFQNEFPTIAPPFGGLVIAVERCPLCERTKKPFTCQKCVEKGDFVHSNSCGFGKNSERFSDKLHRLHHLRKERSDVFEKVSKKLDRAVSIAAKKWEISMLKDRLELMQKALEESKERCLADKASKTSQSAKIKDKVTTARNHMIKLERTTKCIDHGKTVLGSRQVELAGCEKRLSELRRSNVNQLTTYIFTINEIHTGDSRPADAEEESDQLVADLAEARQLSYIQGRWIETENSHEVQYSLVHPSAVCVPANGDYTAYSAWVAAKESANQGTDTQLDLSNPGKVLSGALCHTAQLVSLLTYYLGIVLPKKCPFSVFCGEQLSSHDFYKAVDKLNTNVLYLCFSQNVDIECLHPHYTVRNLLALLSSSNVQLGRNGPVDMTDVHADLLKSVPRTSHTSLTSESESASESLSHLMDEDSDTSGDLEWENVPDSQVPTLTGNPSTATSPLPESVASFQQDGSEDDGAQLVETVTEGSPAGAAGGLMSSAAASVVSLWRAATSQR